MHKTPCTGSLYTLQCLTGKVDRINFQKCLMYFPKFLGTNDFSVKLYMLCLVEIVMLIESVYLLVVPLQCTTCHFSTIRENPYPHVSVLIKQCTQSFSVDHD